MIKEIQIEGKIFTQYIPYSSIDKRNEEIAQQMNAALKDDNPLFLVVLNGAFMFASDLLKKVTIPCEISFIKLSSYSGMSSSGTIKQLIGLDETLNNRNVVIIEDIVDTGKTMQSVVNQLGTFNPKSVKIASLLVKPECIQIPVQIDYTGFEIPDAFVVGYGLDLNGQGRNLTDIYQLKS
jgi:hypoxanthine phosphoribosyltransferase